ncbi:MAG: DUF6311 domain-containing protein [Oscillospiraceae bacterium]
MDNSLAKKSLLRKIGYTRFAVLIGGAIGAVFFLVVFGFETLNVTNDSFIMNGHVETDVICEYLGWINLRNSEWMFPIGCYTTAGFPHGNSVALTGSLPIFSIFFKLLSPILPQTFQFVGIWNLLHYILQGASAALLISLFTDSLFTNAIASLLFVASPIMAERAFRHNTLSTHFLLLLAFYLYIKIKREPKPRYFVLFIALLVVSVLYVAYFYAMVFAIFAAAVSQYAFRKKKFAKSLFNLALGILLPVAAAYCIGMFSSQAPVAREGFGLFSLNLNQIYNPYSFGDLNWSQVLPYQKFMQYQYDSFNYLGFGVIVGCFVSVILFVVKYKSNTFRRISQMLRDHTWLALALLALTLYSLSNVIYFGETLVLGIPLPQFVLRLCAYLRASSRMFYPVYYMFFIVTVVAFVKLLPKNWSKAALVALVAVQLFDISGGLIWKHNALTDIPKYYNLHQSDLLEDLRADYDKLIYLTDYNSNDMRLGVYYAKLGYTTNFNASPLNDIYGSSQFAADCLEQLKRGEFMPDTIYVCPNEAVYDSLKKPLEGKAAFETFGQTLYIIPNEVD